MVMFRDAAEVERAERDQESDNARIAAAVNTAHKAIAALAARPLGPGAARKEWAGIRDRTILGIRDVRHNVIKRAKLARETERWMVEKWLREINDGRILREFTAELQQVPTAGLLDYLRYLIGFADIARIQSVNAVFAARPDKHGYKAAFDAMLGQFTLSQCGLLGARIARIHKLAELVDAKIFDLFSAQSTSRRPSLVLSQSLPRIEGPSIGALEVDTALAGAPRGALAVLESPSRHEGARILRRPLAGEGVSPALISAFAIMLEDQGVTPHDQDVMRWFNPHRGSCL